MKKTMMKLLSVVMALMMLFGCFSTLVSAVDTHEHDKATKLETIAPRCNAYGYTLYICSCGETWATDIVAKTEGVHSLEVDGSYVAVDAKAPSCEADGYKAGKACAWCGKIVEGGEKSGDKTGHKYDWVLVEGDCNNIEAIVYKCVNANCERNGALADDPIKLVNCEADGHNFVYKITKYPTCEMVADVAGTAYRVSVDGDKLPGYKVTSANGEAEYECLDCGVKYTGIVVTWFNHDAKNLVHKTNGKVDDCENFTAEWDECLVCGYATNYVKKDTPNAHNYVLADLAVAQKAGYASNFREALCHLNGYKVLQCTFCQDIKVETNTVDHVMAYSCPVDANCVDCTHEGRVYKCKNFKDGGCQESTPAKYDKHEWGTTKYYSFLYNGEEIVGEYKAEMKLCANVQIFTKCTHANCEARNNLYVIEADANNVTNHVHVVYIAGSEYKEADCENDGYIMTNCLACLRTNLKLVGAEAKAFVEENDVEVLADYNFIALGHNTVANGKVSKEAVAATCNAKGSTAEYVCNRFGTCTHVIQKSEPIEINPNNHKETSLVQIGDSIPATCTTPKTDYYRCSDCGHTVHKEGTLNQFNHTKYTIDKDNFKIITSATVTGKAALTHYDAKDVVCGETDGNYAYNQCKFCYHIVSYEVEDEVTGDVETITERDVNGNGLYNGALDKNNDGDYADAGEYASDIYFTIADVTISSAHKFVNVAGQKETCTVDGWNAYQLPCTRCGAESPLTKKIIPAHGTNFTTVVSPENAYAPTCTLPGVAAGVYCAECDTKDGVKIQTGTKDGNPVYMDWKYNSKPNFAKPAATDPWYIAPLGHYKTAGNYSSRLPHMVEITAPQELDRVIVDKGTCRVETYRIIYCTYCLSSENYDVTDENDYNTLVDILLGKCEDDGRKIGNDAWILYKMTKGIDHIYPEAIYEDNKETGVVKNVTTNFDLDNDGKVDANFDECVTAKEWYVTCTNTGCTATHLVKTEAAKGHYYIENGKEVIIDITCTEIEKFANWSCSKCNKIVGKDIAPVHSVVEVTEYPGCESNEPGRQFFACEHCDARYFADLDSQEPVDPKTYTDDYNPYVTVIPATGHDFVEFKRDKSGKLDGFKPATYTEEGYVTRVCTKCGDVVEILPKLVPSLNVTVKTDKTTVASGDAFKVTVSYSGDYYQFNALQIDLRYDNKNTLFLKEALDETLPAGVVVKEENDGKIVLAIYTLDGVALEPGEVKTIELTFRARKNFAKTDIVWFESAKAFNLEGAEIDSETVKIKLGAAAQVTSLVTGELNGYAGINAGDAIVMMDLIYAEKYSAVADLNKDGKVDVKDFALLSKLIATDGSDDAYAKFVNANITPVNGVFYERVS